MASFPPFTCHFLAYEFVKRLGKDCNVTVATLSPSLDLFVPGGNGLTVQADLSTAWIVCKAYNILYLTLHIKRFESSLNNI